MNKMANKWLEKEHKYIPYELPEGASFYENDMDKEISCCSCGKKVKYGDTYTSRHIHNGHGFGYAECEECYNMNNPMLNYYFKIIDTEGNENE